MAEIAEVTTSSPAELLSTGRRHLAVKDFSSAAGTLSKACELLAQEHGELGDQCAEAYLWYGKALLGLSREESGVLGDGMRDPANAEEEDNDDENEGNEAEENDGAEDKDESEAQTMKEELPEEKSGKETNGEVQHSAAESTTTEDASSSADVDPDKPGPSNGEANEESAVDLEAEDDVDNLQLAWEMLESARNILEKRVTAGGEPGAVRALLADVHLTLGEVALESETYDKAVTDMLACLEIQKELYRNDDRRIAETHYQIGLASSLASNFEDAITHFKNAANILQSRIKTLESPTAAAEDATVKKFTTSDPFYSIDGEIKELKELLPEIQEKIQDMMDYKAETIKRLRETLCGTNGDAIVSTNGAGSSTSAAKPAASDISHLIKRKRKASDSEEPSTAAKRSNT